MGRKGRAVDGRNIYFLFSYFFPKHEWHLCLQCVKEVLGYGGFHLTKYIVNDTHLLEQIPESDRAKEVKEIAQESWCKALGIRWDFMTDEFFYVSRYEPEDTTVTHRTILSIVSAMYDPLGLISPIILRGRMIFQDATRRGLSWDDPVPLDLNKKWGCWLRSLASLSGLRFKRCIIPVGFEDGVLELHNFSDASEVGYGACCYIRCVNRSGRVCVTLLASKGRLAPLKQTTIPRLELCAAVESVKLDALVKRALDVELLPSTFWTDSEITRAYIRNDTKRFKVFVANRVSYIRQQSLPSQWLHVCSAENPAAMCHL